MPENVSCYDDLDHQHQPLSDLDHQHEPLRDHPDHQPSLEAVTSDSSSQQSTSESDSRDSNFSSESVCSNNSTQSRCMLLSSFSGSDDESDEDEIRDIHVPLFPGSEHSVDEAVVDLLSDYLENTETKVSLKDHFQTLQKYLPKPNNLPNSVYLLLKYVMGAAPSHVEKEHLYCKKCFLPWVKENQKCQVCGSISFRSFYVFSIEEQIKYYFEQGKLKDILDNRADVNDGKIRDICNGSEYIRVKINELYSVTLLLNTDGVSASNSSNTELWPLLYVICEIPAQLRSSYLLLCGVWCDSKKPPMNMFLKPLVDELVAIDNKGGVTWSCNGVETKSKVIAPLICADAPARASLMNVLNHNSKYACNLCEQKSLRIPLTADEALVRLRGNRKLRRKRAFLFKEEPSRLRSHDRMMHQAALAYRTKRPVKGVRGPTVLSAVPAISLATCVYPEYMHLVCLGSVRHFMDLWFNVPGRWNIAQHISDIDNFMKNIKPPSYICRLPTGVSDMKNWKASAFRAWLLFYSLPALVRFLPKDYMQHWLLFVMAMFLLLQEEISEADLTKADTMLQLFVRDIGRLYRKKDYVYNTHCLLHLPLIVRRWGPLQCSSAYIFENYNGVLTKLIHGTKNRAKELMNILKIARGLEVLKLRVKAFQERDEAKGRNQKVLGSHLDPNKYLNETDKLFLLSSGFDSRYCISSRASFQQESFTSLLYKREKARNNYTVTFKFANDDRRGYGEIKYFISKTDVEEVLAVVDVLKVDHTKVFYHEGSRAKASHIIPITKTELERHTVIVPLSNILCKVICVADFICLCPNLLEKNL